MLHLVISEARVTILLVVVFGYSVGLDFLVNFVLVAEIIESDGINGVLDYNVVNFENFNGNDICGRGGRVQPFFFEILFCVAQCVLSDNLNVLDCVAVIVVDNCDSCGSGLNLDFLCGFHCGNSFQNTRCFMGHSYYIK